jgi:hypothetical protein
MRYCKFERRNFPAGQFGDDGEHEDHEPAHYANGRLKIDGKPPVELPIGIDVAYKVGERLRLPAVR